MWTNDVFLPSIKAGETMMGKPDLQLIANKFQATADLPMALYFEQVMEEFPDCKFILTVRENSEVWFRSWDTLTKSITETTNLGGFFFSNVRQYSYYLRWLFSVVNKDESYLTDPFPLPHQQKQAAIESYEEHNRSVREKVPAHRLLEYNVKEGWAPLCSFLEIAECPQTHFPKTNSARAVQVQAISAFICPFICFLFVLFYAFASVFQRATGMTVLQWSSWKSKELMMTLRRVMLGDTDDAWRYPQVRKSS
jgi:Sulfotransferase domain